jgi:hypothetical protein
VVALARERTFRARPLRWPDLVNVELIFCAVDFSVALLKRPGSWWSINSSTD